MPHPLRNSVECQVKKPSTKLKTSWKMKRYVNLVHVDNFLEVQPRTAPLITAPKERTRFTRRGGGLSMERFIFSTFKGGDSNIPHILFYLFVSFLQSMVRIEKCDVMICWHKASAVLWISQLNEYCILTSTIFLYSWRSVLRLRVTAEGMTD